MTRRIMNSNRTTKIRKVSADKTRKTVKFARGSPQKRRTSNRDKSYNDCRLQRELETQNTQKSNLERDARHKRRNAQKVEEEKERESLRRRERVAAGLPEEDPAQVTRSYRIRQSVVNDIKFPYAWWEHQYGEPYEGSDHFKIKEY